MLSYDERPRLTFLPICTTLLSGRRVLVDYMKELHLQETFRMVKEASEDGSGFCVEEYPNFDVFHDELRYGDFFGVFSEDTGELLASFLLAVSKYYRGWRVADTFIIVKKSERRQKIGEFCMRLAINYAREIGYIGMYVDLFSNNEPVIKILEKIGGFDRVGYLPLAGHSKDEGLMSGYIYFKDLRVD